MEKLWVEGKNGLIFACVFLSQNCELERQTMAVCELLPHICVCVFLIVREAKRRKALPWSLTQGPHGRASTSEKAS